MCGRWRGGRTENRLQGAGSCSTRCTLLSKHTAGRCAAERGPHLRLFSGTKQKQQTEISSQNLLFLLLLLFEIGKGSLGDNNQVQKNRVDSAQLSRRRDGGGKASQSHTWILHASFLSNPPSKGQQNPNPQLGMQAEQLSDSKLSSHVHVARQEVLDVQWHRGRKAHLAPLHRAGFCCFTFTKNDFRERF